MDIDIQEVYTFLQKGQEYEKVVKIFKTIYISFWSLFTKHSLPN